MRVERSIVLPCPPARAWDFLVDWERQADWMMDADSVRVVSTQRDGVGVRLAVRTRLFGVPAFTEPMDVIGWDPPRRLVIRHGGPVAGEGTWALGDVPGGTAFTWVEDVRLQVPFVGELLARCYAPFLRYLMGRAMRGLRSYVVATGP